MSSDINVMDFYSSGEETVDSQEVDHFDDEREDSSRSKLETYNERKEEQKKKKEDIENKIKDLKEEMELLMKNMHPKFLEQKEVLEKQLKDEQGQINDFFDMEISKARRLHREEMQSIKRWFEDSKIKIKETAKIQLERDRRRFYDDRMLTINDEEINIPDPPPRILRKRRNDKQCQSPVKMPRRTIRDYNYKLSEEKIQSDLDAIGGPH